MIERTDGNASSDPTARTLRRLVQLIFDLVRREVIGRYRGSALGIIWSLLTPLFMLAIYTFVFGTIFKARWTGQSEDASIAEFAIMLFSGLIVFQLFAEVVTRAPMLILSNSNYVKKVVFPLQILVPVALGSALFHFAVSLLVLFAFVIAVFGSIPLTAFLFPLVLVPFCLMILGLGWFFASLGTYLRDIGQFLGTLVTALMFLSPIFFPVEALPDWLQPYIYLNPIALPVEQFRDAAIIGLVPDPGALAIYSVISLIIAFLGYQFFEKTRKGFADVL